MKTVLRRFFLLALLMVVLLALLLVVETTGAQGGVGSKLVLAIVLITVGLLVPVGAIVYLRFFRKRPPKG